VDLAEFQEPLRSIRTDDHETWKHTPSTLAPEDKMRSGQEASRLARIIAEFPEASERLMEPLKL